MVTQAGARKRLALLWDEATGLHDAERSPLTGAIINECLESTEPGYDYAAMARAMDTLIYDCGRFAAAIRRIT